MVEIDLTGISAFIPVFGFLLVFVVTYALLGKTKALGENKFVHILVSFAVSIIFLVSASAVQYVKLIAPWFAVLIVSLLFIALVVGLIKGDIDKFFQPWFAWIIVVVLVIGFVVSAIYVFGDLITKSLAGPKTFLMQPSVIGIIILLVLTVFASWLLTRK